MRNELTQEQAIALFRKFDDPKNWEHPEEFDYKQAVDTFKSFHKQLEKLTKRELPNETENYIQDASFHAQINLGENNWLRFSNFGNLISVLNDETVKPEILDAVKKLAKEFEYVYIPGKYTDQAYGGKNIGITGISDWWIRFFDWV